MKIDVVITHYNDSKCLKVCLSALLKYTGADVNIIIADAGSNIKEFKSIKEIGFDIVGTPLNNTNFSQTCNKAIKKVKSEYFLILNCDTILLNGSIDKLVNTLKGDNKLAMCGTASNFDSNPYYVSNIKLLPYLDRKTIFENLDNIVEFIKNYNKRDNDFIKKVIIPAFACIYRKDLFNEVEGFDENYRNGYEDFDLCMKFNKSGYKVGIENGVYVFHFGGISKNVKIPNENYNRFMKKWGNFERNF